MAIGEWAQTRRLGLFAPQDSPGARWLGLAAICGAMLMLLMDITIVQVALPAIHRAFHSTFTDLQWVISAYALTLSSLILTCGSLADRWGRKRMFMGGLAMFTTASLLCGLATGTVFLNLARAVQGVGGAAMFATSLALVGQEFQGADRAKALGIWGAAVGGGVAIGPLVGGTITSGIGWRWIFFVNVPVGVVTVVMAARYLVNKKDPDVRSLDLGGLVTFFGALFLLNFGLLRGTDKGWANPLILGCFAGAALVFVLFLAVELRQRRPMFEMSLFRNPGFLGVSIGTFAIGTGMFSLFVFITLYLQNGLGYSPLASGLRLAPLTVPIFVVPLLVRRVVQKLPPGSVLGGGLVVVAVGIALMHQVSASSTWEALLPGMLVAGVGIGVANPAIGSIALGVVNPARSGMASGISNTMRLCGVATGIAALGAIFQARVASDVHHILPGAPAGLAGAVASGGRAATRAALAHAGAGGPSAVSVVGRAYSDGMDALFVVGAVVLAAGAAIALLTVRQRHFFAASAQPQVAMAVASE
jgi:EmrB/QacA subfamily drug resistance transporter